MCISFRCLLPTSAMGRVPYGGTDGSVESGYIFAKRVRAALRAMALRSAGVWWANRVRAAFRALALRSAAVRCRACFLAWRARAPGEAACRPSRRSALVMAFERLGLVLAGERLWPAREANAAL